jgi:uncharacterized membrane protein YeaQ/YmgE (transglycosylase-associated protein family)
MGLLLWIAFGVLAGLVARLIMPGPAAGGIVVAVLVGVSGALLGGVGDSAMDGAWSPQTDARSLLMAGIGAIVLLFCYRSYAMRFPELT